MSLKREQTREDFNSVARGMRYSDLDPRRRKQELAEAVTRSLKPIVQI
jgi:hypothetical protein